jgi:hypothetical protein
MELTGLQGEGGKVTVTVKMHGEVKQRFPKVYAKDRGTGAYIELSPSDSEIDVKEVGAHELTFDRLQIDYDCPEPR